MKRFSVIQKEMTECYVCGTCKNIHIHHIFAGNPNRKLSEKRHFIVALCGQHHNLSNEGVHFNRELDLHLKKMAQEYYEEHYGTREEFIREFSKSYL